jgi:hypothetical protein
MKFLLPLALAASILAVSPALGEEAKPHAANTQQAKPGEMQIGVATLVVMIRGTVMALHQANLTGNYSVLRDLGTPVFRENFDQAALTQAFANLRARKVDLSAALLVNPNLSKNPEIKDGELILSGEFPTQPLQIKFDLRFMQLDGVWRIAGMGVDAVPAPGPQAMAAAPSPAPQPVQPPAPKKQPPKPKS